MRRMKRFGSDERGATAAIFGLTLVPLMLVSAIAIDYTRAAQARTRMQAAIDAAVLTATKEAPNLSDGALAARARRIFDIHFSGEQGSTVTAFTVTRVNRAVRIEAKADVPAMMAPIFGQRTVAIGSTTTAAYGQRRIELALVLDNTGSMAWSGKMVELKKAAHNLLNALEPIAANDAVKIAIVPFDTHVNVGAGNRNANWLRFIGLDRDTWNGCVEDRDQPHDASDAAPVSYGTLYPAKMCDNAALARLRPLTNDFSALRTTVNAMAPSGYTNVTIGVVWGLAALSPDAPLAGASAFNTPLVDKIMIVLTDGDNTKNRTTPADTNTAAIDARTRAACDAAKGPPANPTGIKIYTVRVIEGNRNLLRGCASDPGKYKEVGAASELDGVFQSIVKEIKALRLTS